MKRILAAVALLLLVGCGPPMMDAEVTRYHDPAGVASGRSFTIEPVGAQIGALDFESFAEQVAAALGALGFHPVPHDGPPADLVVHMRYGGDGERTEIDTYETPGMGPNPWRWGPDPVFAPNERVFTYPVYGHYLEIDLLDGPVLRAGTTKMVFQGRAAGQSDAHDINPVFPALVRVLFAGFPGPSGQTERVRVPVF